MKTWLSDDVKALNLPLDAVKQLTTTVKSDRPVGKGKFHYLPVTIQYGGKSLELVLVEYHKRHKRCEPGDCAVYLRSEWDTAANPL